MSNVNVSVSGPASATRRATGAGPEIGRYGKGCSLCQAQSECRSGAASWRRSGVDEPQVWRHRRHPQRVARRLPGRCAEALKVRPVARLDEQGRRQKGVIAEMAMEIEPLRERIRLMEGEKPFLRWRSRK
jgi:hypothetical protein